MTQPIPSRPPLWARFVESVAIAAVYVATAKVSQVVALPPGNVSPIWIPAGIMLAWVVLRGRYLVVGVALGAAAGHALGWIDTVTVATAPLAFVAATLNGVGDALSVLIGARFYRRSSDGVPLGDPPTLLRFLLAGAVLGPLVSAIFGVGGLALSGLAPLARVPTLFTTWWIGDGIGALVLAPAILFVADQWADVIRPGRMAERAGVAIASVGAIALWIFALAPVWIEIGDLMVFVIVAWVAVRFTPADTVLTLLPLVAIRTGIAVVESAEIAAVSAQTALLAELMVFTALGSLASLLIAVSVDWNRRNHERLGEAMADNAQVLRMQDAAIRSVANIVFVADPAGIIRWVNEAFEQRTGFAKRDAVDQPVSVLNSGTHPPEYFESFWQTIQSGAVWQGRVINRTRDGARLSLHQVVTPIRGDDGEIEWYVAVQTDTSDLLRDQDRLVEFATHDDLTGLANRARVRIALHRLYVESRRMNDGLAVAVIDLDRFKPINDAHGHAAGDEVLVAVAHRMRGAIREMDLAARTGGDEFVLVLPRIPSAEVAVEIVQRVVTSIAAPVAIRLDDGTRTDVSVGASAGIAVTDTVEAEPNVLLAAADRAMYRAKEAGGRQVCVATARDAVPRGHTPATLPASSSGDPVLRRLTLENRPLDPSG